MKSYFNVYWFSNLIVLGLSSLSASAQITPDGSLPTNIISPDSLNFTIENGARSGTNLFHSFQEFSVPTNGSAFFNNAADIQNIFSRVTGENLSHIDGLLRANGGANLFLLNPNGIVFGPNARLDIGGSFVGTTANSIRFSDGVEFSAVNPTATPLLTMSAPIGLQMGQAPGTIAVQNTGHRLLEGNALLEMGTTPRGLSVAPGTTFALVGGEIALEGGIVTAPSGQLELGSASSGTVHLNTASPHWNFDYSTLQQYGDIRFSRQALASASGTPGGSIHLQGRNISVNEGSVVLLNNQGNQGSGDITVNASESLQMRGVGPNGFTQSLLVAGTTTGTGGNLEIAAPQLLLQDGARIATHTVGTGTGGNLSVVADSIQIVGFSPLKPATTRSGIASEARGAGRAGDIQVTTRQLRLQDGGSITGATFGTGATGNLMLNASESIELNGETPISFSASLVGVVSFNRGNAGNVTVNTPRLSVQNGAGVSASTLGQGGAGTLRVNVSEQITVRGVSAASGKPGAISASATVLPLSFQQTFGLPALPTGNSGDLIVNTPRLEITDGGVVRVNHQGVGNAGTLYINANTIALDRSGNISAATNSGQGGEINLQVRDLLLLRQGSRITATAGGTGNGGNITIDSPTIVGLDNSDIIANAVQGSGGNIQINTQGIFGLENRPELTPESDISASSQFGVSGTVAINNPTADASLGVENLPQDPIDPTQQVVLGCQQLGDSHFIATGRGGIPAGPDSMLQSTRVWNDLRDLSALEDGEIVDSATLTETSEPLTEATTWVRNDRGQIELVAVTERMGDRFSPPQCNPVVSER